MKNERRMEVKVGLFLNLGIALLMLAIWLLGSTQNLFAHNIPYVLELPSAEGLNQGSKVMVAGVSAGTVQNFDLNENTGQVTIHFEIAPRFAHALKQNSYAELNNQGVLGDRYISIIPGTPDYPALSPSSAISVRSTPNLSNVLGRSDDLLNTLNQIALSVQEIVLGLGPPGQTHKIMAALGRSVEHLNSLTAKMDRQLNDHQISQALTSLNSILSKVDQGNGAIGGLINDPALYDDMKKLLGQVNSNRIVRNLVRKSVNDADEQEAQARAAS